MSTTISTHVHSRAQGLTRKRQFTYVALVFAAAVLVSLAHVPILRGVGSFLIVEDSLQPAAAIVALGGQTPFREMEAAQLYRAGWAPFIVLVPRAPQKESRALKELGIRLKEGWEVSREVLVNQGVPVSAVVVANDTAEGTLEELRAAYAAVTAYRPAASRSEIGDRRSDGDARSEIRGQRSATNQTSEVPSTLLRTGSDGRSDGDARSEIRDRRSARAGSVEQGAGSTVRRAKSEEQSAVRGAQSITLPPNSVPSVYSVVNNSQDAVRGEALGVRGTTENTIDNQGRTNSEAAPHALRLTKRSNCA